MKTDERGDAKDRPRWRTSFVGDPSAIFFMENGTGAQNQKKILPPKKTRGGLFVVAFPP
jgi:hypothetical protein